MAEIDNSLILEPLKQIQDRLGRVEDKLDALGADMRNLKAHQTASMSSEVVQDTAIASLAFRLERVERRLDLRDEH